MNQLAHLAASRTINIIITLKFIACTPLAPRPTGAGGRVTVVVMSGHEWQLKHLFKDGFVRCHAGL
jgi:hypothetical protein